MMEFLESAYGKIVIMAGVMATLWGLMKAIGALRKWMHARIEESKARLELPEKLMEKLQKLEDKMNAKDAELSSQLESIKGKIDDVIEQQHFSADQIATMQNEKLVWAYLYYGKAGHPIAMQTKLSLERMYAQYKDAGKRNHVPEDWYDVMSRAVIEGTEPRE